LKNYFGSPVFIKNGKIRRPDWNSVFLSNSYSKTEQILKFGIAFYPTI